MKLYDWQKGCLRAWKENGFRGIAHVVTGGGKTVMALYAARLLEKSCPFPLRVRVVVPTISLARQWRSAMLRHLPACACGSESPGQWGGGRKDSPDTRYMVYVVNSARDALAGHIQSDLKQGRGVLLIADECHHYASPENRNIFQFIESGRAYMDRYFSLGLSATPQTAGYETVLVPALGKEICHYGFAEAARARTVSRFFVYQIALSFLAGENAEYTSLSSGMSLLLKQLTKESPFLADMPPGAFFAFLSQQAARDEDCAAARFLKITLARSQITYMAAARSACALDLIGELGLSRQILIFGERIQQADAVWERLERRFPGRAGRYHSALPPDVRRNVLERFRTGELRILITCRALDEGIDVPAASVGIILSGTSVSRQRIQRLGRILRKSGEKSAACMYYLYVKEAAEESAFLADAGDSFPVCSLSYEFYSHTFIHPGYEAAAAAVLEDARRQGISGPPLKEIRRCLQAGLIRPDWLLSAEEIEERIAQADGRKERNYWVCVREMRRLKRRDGDVYGSVLENIPHPTPSHTSPSPHINI